MNIRVLLSEAVVLLIIMILALGNRAAASIPQEGLRALSAAQATPAVPGQDPRVQITHEKPVAPARFNGDLRAFPPNIAQAGRVFRAPLEPPDPPSRGPKLS